MKRWFSVPVAILLLAWLGAIPATLHADDGTKTVSGTVSAVTPDSITIKPDKGDELKFSVDAKTTVVGKGLGTKNAQMKEEKVSPKLVDFLAVGDMVTAKYDDASKRASEVKLVRAAKPIK